MKLLNGDRAIVDADKLSGYCLNDEHPRGKHKAKVFKSALGLTAEDAELLCSALLQAVANDDAVPTDADRYGQRYVLDFTMAGGLGTAKIRSSWIVRTDEDFPRLTSCYVL